MKTNLWIVALCLLGPTIFADTPDSASDAKRGSKTHVVNAVARGMMHAALGSLKASLSLVGGSALSAKELVEKRPLKAADILKHASAEAGNELLDGIDESVEIINKAAFHSRSGK